MSKYKYCGVYQGGYAVLSTVSHTVGAERLGETAPTRAELMDQCKDGQCFTTEMWSLEILKSRIQIMIHNDSQLRQPVHISKNQM